MTTPRRTRALPPNPSIGQHRKQAKYLLKAYRSGDTKAAERLRAALPRFASLLIDDAAAAGLTLVDAQFAIAREHGFDSWPKFQRHIEAVDAANRARVKEFLTAATPDPLQDHRTGTAEAASALLADHPDLPVNDIFAAAAVGNADAMGRLLEQDKTLAARKGGPRDWEPLQYVCFSRFLRTQPERTEDFIRAAQLLLGNGANPNAFFDSNGETETVLYGAGGVARNPALTRLLLESGANANDADLEYHAAEVPDPTCLMLLVEHGLDLNRNGTALLRKLDFDEPENVKLLLEAGADPNAGMAMWGRTALHQAIIRGRSVKIVRLLGTIRRQNRARWIGHTRRDYRTADRRDVSTNRTHIRIGPRLRRQTSPLLREQERVVEWGLVPHHKHASHSAQQASSPLYNKSVPNPLRPAQTARAGEKSSPAPKPKSHTLHPANR